MRKIASKCANKNLKNNSLREKLNQTSAQTIFHISNNVSILFIFLDYTCSKCCMNSMFSTMCFCIKCFDLTKHAGHDYTKRVSYSDQAYCDCGRPSRIK